MKKIKYNNIPLASFINQNKDNGELKKVIAKIFSTDDTEIESNFSNETKEKLESFGFLVEYQTLFDNYIVKW